MCVHVFITYVIYLYWSIQQGLLGYWLSQFPEWALLVTLHQLCEVFTHMRRQYVKRFAWDHSIGRKNEYLKINVIVFWDQASCTLSWPLTHNVLKNDLDLVTFLSCWGVHHICCVMVAMEPRVSWMLGNDSPDWTTVQSKEMAQVNNCGAY